MIVNGYEIKPGVDLSEANLSGANLFGANLSGANLSGANLSGADFSVAYLYGVSLYRADLSGANLYETNLSGANLYGAKGILRLGPSLDGYEFFCVIRDGVPWVKAGCRWFTIEDGRKHWEETRGGTAIGEERLMFLTLFEQWAKNQTK